jgi:hypothetical protein
LAAKQKGREPAIQDRSYIFGWCKTYSEAFKDENMKELNRLLNQYITMRIKSEIVETYGNA